MLDQTLSATCRSQSAMAAIDGEIQRFKNLPDDCLVTAKTVMAVYGISLQTLARELKKPDSRVPAPISRPGERRKWRAGDIRRALRGEAA